MQTFILEVWKHLTCLDFKGWYAAFPALHLAGFSSAGGHLDFYFFFSSLVRHWTGNFNTWKGRTGECIWLFVFALAFTLCEVRILFILTCRLDFFFFPPLFSWLSGTVFWWFFYDYCVDSRLRSNAFLLVNIKGRMMPVLGIQSKVSQSSLEVHHFSLKF